MGTKARVLIVDDNPKFRKSLSDILKAKGYIPLTAATGKEALDKVKEKGLAVALIDLRLEDMSGLEVMREIKECSPGTECIVITGYASQKSAIDAVHLGAYSYITKPYDMEQLLLTIQRAFEKQEAEEALRENERFLQDVFDAIRDGISVLDLNLKIVRVNSWIEQMYPKEGKLAGMKCYEVYQKRDTPCPWCPSLKTIATGEIHNAIVPYPSEENPTGWIELSSFPLRNIEGDIVGVIEYAKDVTQRKRAEETLRASEEKYRDIFENVSDFIYIHDLEGMFIETNLSFIEKMGYTEDDLANKNVRDLIPEPYKPQFKDYLKKVIEKGKSEGLMRVLTKDGSERIVEYRNSIVYDSTGPIGVRGSARDITERKQAEKELLESEQKYRTLFEDSIDAIVITYREGKLLDVNQAALDLLGYTKVEIMGMNFRELYVDPSNGKRFQQQIDQEGSVANFEVKLRKKDGTELDSLFTVNTKRADDGRIVGYQGFIRDITDQKKLEVQLQQSQKMEAIGILSGGIAHDFNNILAAIIGFAELAKMRVHEDSEVLPDLDQILKSGNRAKTLIQQILAFSRKQDLKQKPLQLKYIVKESLKLLRSTLPSDIEIQEDIAKDVGVVNADPTQMHQVIMNLCTNADHAMQEKGGVLAVGLANVELDDIAAAQYLDMSPGPYLRLSVSDTGYGMNPDVKERIFEPYFTTKEKGVGTGLGLSVVHGIVKNHNGEITVYSEPGKGSTFHVYLPLIQEEAIKREMDEQALIPTGNERILFIDDEKALVDLGKQMLERLGYKVTTRTSSLEALELFKIQPDQFDLVITDMTMPKMTGDKLAKDLMKIRHDIPIIICTGYSERISEEKAKGMGIKVFAMKPLVMGDLANTVRKVLDEEKEGPAAGLILVIDDDDQFREMLRETLEYAGYKVADAPNGKEGIRLFRENPADLVITDLIMPEKEGIETIKELRRDFPEVKTIAISGGGRIGPDSYLKMAKGLGALRTLTKPIERDELLKTVRELVNAGDGNSIRN